MNKFEAVLVGTALAVLTLFVGWCLAQGPKSSGSYHGRVPTVAHATPSPTPRKPIRDKNGKEWPECVPPELEDRAKGWSLGGSINGIGYRCSSEGRWVVDEDAARRFRESQAVQADLIDALITRKLTKSELAKLSPRMNVFAGQAYFPCGKYADLYDMLVKQWELQAGAKMPFRVHLSRALGEYNRCPQERDNESAVENLIRVLQEMP